MPIVHYISELCAVACLAKNIPGEIILIQDTLALFLKRIKLTFSDRPDKLVVGMEVWCNKEPVYLAGIIRYIDISDIFDIGIGVELYYEHPHAKYKNQTRDVVLKPDNVFQLFQSIVQFYHVKRRYGFLNHENKTSYFFHGNDVIINGFPNSRIKKGVLVKHSIKYNFHERSQTMDIIAQFVHVP